MTRKGRRTGVRRDGILVQRLSRKQVKLTPKRAVLYKSGKVSGWIGKKEFRSLLKRSEGTIALQPAKRKGFYSVNLNPVILKQNIIINKKKKQVTIKTYTSRQRKYVSEAILKRRKLPISIGGAIRKVIRKFTEFARPFKEVGIGVSRPHKPSP